VGWCPKAGRRAKLIKKNGVRTGCIKNPVGKKL
jgi:hypothetical protein